MTCKHLLNGAPDCVFCHRDQLRQELSLAEEGLANYAEDNKRMRELLVAASEALTAFTTTYNGRPSRFREAEVASGEIIMAAADKLDEFLYPPEPQEGQRG